MHEAQAAGTLNHPNILAVYDLGTHEAAPYLVTELLEGQELRDQLHDGITDILEIKRSGIVRSSPAPRFVANKVALKILPPGVSQSTRHTEAF